MRWIKILDEAADPVVNLNPDSGPVAQRLTAATLKHLITSKKIITQRGWVQLLFFIWHICRWFCDLFKSSLLHVLHLQSPLEPKEHWRVKMFYSSLKRHKCVLLNANVKPRSLRGSFSGFNEVPFLQALEAVLEDAALWLQSHHITTIRETDPRQPHHKSQKLIWGWTALSISHTRF